MPMMMSITVGRKRDTIAFNPKSLWTYSWLERRMFSSQKYAVQPAIQKVNAESGATTINRMTFSELQPSWKVMLYSRPDSVFFGRKRLDHGVAHGQCDYRDCVV